MAKTNLGSGMSDQKIKVYKFGGSSLADAKALSQVGHIIKEAKGPVVVVVSAMGGMTDRLMKAAHLAVDGQLSEIAEETAYFRAEHLKLIETVLAEDPQREALTRYVEQALEELQRICESIGTLSELTPRTLARVVSRGERIMARILAAYLNLNGTAACQLDATKVLKVSPSPIGMYPETAACDKACEVHLLPLLEKHTVVVVPGFIACGPEQELVILGRGGSDFSAAILAASLHAESVTLFKEVDGILTADPRHVREARIVGELHYREAAELAYYGAKVLHPCTIIPLSDRQVPLYIKNTFDPSRPGTLISGEVVPKGYAVKALTAIPGQAVIAVEGKGMMGVPGIAGRTFLCLARGEVSVTMISQASSESSICFVVPGEQAKLARELLNQEFKFEMAHRLVDDIRVKSQKTIIAMVGIGMSGNRGTAARAFSALAREGINIEVIAQGSSELNISVVVDGHHLANALKGLHREFRLEKAHALPDVLGRKVSIGMLGFGQIGQALAEQILNQLEFFKRSVKADLRVVSLTDTSGAVVEWDGLSSDQIKALIERKRSGKKLVDGNGGKLSVPEVGHTLRNELWSLPFAKGIFVDCTASESAPLVREALEASMNVVLANKKPLAIPYEEYQALFDLARKKGLHLRYEATVGAGLPILDTLAKLEAAGDEVITIFGCLSGTLGFLMTQMEDGLAFSQSVKNAYELGYTEPDPREDLSGMDVARKALILARTLGMRLEIEDIQLEPLFPEHLSHDDPKTFIASLSSLDGEFQDRIEKAKKSRQVLRYVARLSRHEVTVRIEPISQDSPLGRLRGTDNQINVRTKRYDDNPLIVTGPGAGAAVTAAGVLNDIVAIATSQGG